MIDLRFFPDPYEFVVTSGGKHVLVLGVSPRDLPARPAVSLESNGHGHLLILCHSTNLDHSAGIARRQSVSIEVELGIVLQTN